MEYTYDKKKQLLHLECLLDYFGSFTILENYLEDRLIGIDTRRPCTRCLF